jgi:putative hydrolase of the HAD superfamily
MITCLLFDFFGTLVEYSRDGCDPLYPRTRQAIEDEFGVVLADHELARSWQRTWMRFEERSLTDHREFSLTEVGTWFLRERLGREPDPVRTRAVMDVYLAEWNSGVRPVDGIEPWLKELAKEYRLAIVSNTNEPDLVPGHVEKMGLGDVFDALVLSVRVGRRKPHPEIYAHALQTLGVQPHQAVFVGDTLDCDFHGPAEAGIRSFLIDPGNLAGLPAQHRLGTVFDLSAHLH